MATELCIAPGADPMEACTIATPAHGLGTTWPEDAKRSGVVAGRITHIRTATEPISLRNVVVEKAGEKFRLLPSRDRSFDLPSGVSIVFEDARPSRDKSIGDWPRLCVQYRLRPGGNPVWLPASPANRGKTRPVWLGVRVSEGLSADTTVNSTLVTGLAEGVFSKGPTSAFPLDEESGYIEIPWKSKKVGRIPSLKLFLHHKVELERIPFVIVPADQEPDSDRSRSVTR